MAALLGPTTAVVLGGTALYAVNRAERLTMDEVIGLYRVEPTARGNATDRILFQRFLPDGRTWLEEIRLVEDPGVTEDDVDPSESGGRT